MNKDGDVIIIEDDEDDREMFEQVFNSLNYKNKLVFFRDGDAALEHLCKTEVTPFLILSDINMPRINGLELRQKINTNAQLHEKCIPYLFFTTTANKKSVLEAYAMSVQGFFVKPDTFQKLENSIRKIMEYWKECIAPNEFI